MVGTLPVVGTPLLYLLRGGEEVSGVTLLRLYDLHTKLLPALLGGLVLGHVVIVRLMGFVDVKGSRGFHPFFPEHTLKMGAIAVGLLVLIVDLVMIFPRPWANQPILRKWRRMSRRLGTSRLPTCGLPCFLGRWRCGVSSGGAALFVVYPFVDRELARRGWPMAVINAIVGTLVVLGVVALMALDTRM